MLWVRISIRGHFQQYFSNIMAVSVLGGRNRRTWRKPSTCPCGKSLTHLSHNAVHVALIEIRTHNISGDCIGSCKSNYHTITAPITPLVSSTFSYLYLRISYYLLLVVKPFSQTSDFSYAFCFIGFMKSKKFKVSDGQQFHQYQQNELSPLTLINVNTIVKFCHFFSFSCLNDFL
jgi:hypothetical protein